MYLKGGDDERITKKESRLCACSRMLSIYHLITAMHCQLFKLSGFPPDCISAKNVLISKSFLFSVGATTATTATPFPIHSYNILIIMLYILYTPYILLFLIFFVAVVAVVAL